MLGASNKLMCHSEECNDEESQLSAPSLMVEIPLFARNDKSVSDIGG
jgi:hypothetical protein